MNTKRQTSREYFQMLRIMYYALIAGQMFFGLIALYLNMADPVDSGENELRDILIYLVPLFVIFGLIAGNFLYRSRLQVCRKKSDLIEKMSDYRSALILRYAFLEGPSLFSIIAYLLTGDFLFMGMAIFMIGLFITIPPTRSKAVFDLELSPEDQQFINNPDSEIASVKTQTMT